MNSDQQIVWTVAIGLIPVAIAFAFIVFLFYRRKRELVFRQREAELNKQISEVEMKALRSQMNPHFIFNCMNSIYKFMKQNDTDKAGDYLVRFSQLIRSVLENSKHKDVILADELISLELYIQMEQLRLQHSFDYKITVDRNLDPENTLTPPLLLQPFLENAIWHGLKNRKTPGLLNVEILKEKNTIIYTIHDNGTKPEEEDLTEDLKTKITKTSMGSALTKERIDLINYAKGSKAGLTEEDILDEKQNYCGHRATIILPYESAN